MRSSTVQKHEGQISNFYFLISTFRERLRMNLKQNILLSLVILLLGALLLIVIFDDHGLADLHLLKIDKARIIKKNERLARENISLYRNIDRLKNDLAFIENVARQEMGMIGKDEVIFKLKKQGLKK